MQSTLGIAKLNPVGRGKELARQSKRNERASLGLEPARLLMREDNQAEQHAGAVNAQQQRQFL